MDSSFKLEIKLLGNPTKCREEFKCFSFEKEASYVVDDNEYESGRESEDEEDEECNEQGYAPSVEHDPNNPPMEVGSTYANMYTFKVALSQNAIKKRFEFNMEKSEPKRYMAYCSMRDKEKCPWWIFASTTKDDTSVMVRLCTFVRCV